MHTVTKYILLILSSLGIVLLTIIYLAGDQIVVLNPKGVIGLKEKELMTLATVLMLIVVVPVFILTFAFAWKYRADNKKAKYTPQWADHPIAEMIWWGVPCVIVIILSVFAWKKSHELDPFKPLSSPAGDPIRIQVVALQWKWLFIYPDYKIASMNFFQVPENIPINFEITADAPMNSFWIPQLGGQVYAMPAMRTKLHLIANEIGSYAGSSANLSGKGFAGMRFIAKATSEADFNTWIAQARTSPLILDHASYENLVKPTEKNPVASYVVKEEDLFDQILMKYMMPQK